MFLVASSFSACVCWPSVCYKGFRYSGMPEVVLRNPGLVICRQLPYYDLVSDVIIDLNGVVQNGTSLLNRQCRVCDGSKTLITICIIGKHTRHIIFSLLYKFPCLHLKLSIRVSWFVCLLREPSKQ